MAKKRMVTQDINFDEDFNSLSLEAQLIFLRCLTIADDCGVFPASEFTLQGLINCPDKLRKNFNTYLEEILLKKIIRKIEHNGKFFYCFKKESWEENQKYLIKNRTRSEYLKIDVSEFSGIYSNLQEFTKTSTDNESYHIISKEIKIEKEIKIKDRDKEENIFKKFPPSLQDVSLRIQQRDLKVDAENFIAYYESNGWKVGKNIMKNWDSALTTWSKNNYNNNGQHQSSKLSRRGQEFEQAKYDQLELAKELIAGRS